MIGHVRFQLPVSTILIHGLRYTLRIVWNPLSESIDATTASNASPRAPCTALARRGPRLRPRPPPLDAPISFQVNGDSLIYGDIAKNLLLHGRYALTVANGQFSSHPHSPARLPALARPLLQALRNRELLLPPSCQIALELLGCLLLADSRPASPRRISPPPRAMPPSGWPPSVPSPPPMRPLPSPKLPPSLCLPWRSGPRPASIERPAGQPRSPSPSPSPSPRSCVPTEHSSPLPSRPPSFGSFAATIARRHSKLIRMPSSASCSLSRPLPLWAARNWHVFHVFQPLAPRLATDPGETPIPAGSAGPEPGASTSSPPTTSTGTCPAARST